jgi:hypothetical protein
MLQVRSNAQKIGKNDVRRWQLASQKYPLLMLAVCGVQRQRSLFSPYQMYQRVKKTVIEKAHSIMNKDSCVSF